MLAQKHLLDFRRKKGFLLYSDVHIVAASEGYYDDYGQAKKFNDEIPILEGKKAKFWYELK